MADGVASIVVLTMPARAEYLVLSRLMLTGLAEARPFDAETLADLKLAVTEACSNSVRHAYGEEEVGTFSVSYEIDTEKLTIEVLDDGSGFDFEPRLNELLATPGGDLREEEMGLAIVHVLTDELEVGPGTGGRGTRTRFRKWLASAP